MVGEDIPTPYRVVVRDTFEQYKYRIAARAIRNGMSVPDFFLYCAEYVFAHHRGLKRARSVFRKGAREISAAGAAPLPPGTLSPESERTRRRRSALDRFARWAGEELHEDFTGEKPLQPRP